MIWADRMASGILVSSFRKTVWICRESKRILLLVICQFIGGPGVLFADLAGGRGFCELFGSAGTLPEGSFRLLFSSGGLQVIYPIPESSLRKLTRR